MPVYQSTGSSIIDKLNQKHLRIFHAVFPLQVRATQGIKNINYVYKKISHFNFYFKVDSCG